MRIANFAIVGLAGLGSFAATTHAAVPWNVPSGTAPGGTFTYANGGSDSGLFGSPVVLSNGFQFFPTNFFASSSNGVAQTTRDRFYVTINLPANAPAGTYLEGIKVKEAGDYAILGGGAVQAAGLMTMTVLASDPGGPTPGTVLFQSLVASPAMPVSTTTAVAGPWTGQLHLDIPTGVRSLQIVMNNILQATSFANGTSLIDKKNTGVEIEVVIPEPATAAVLLGGAGLMLIRRRKA